VTGFLTLTKSRLGDKAEQCARALIAAGCVTDLSHVDSHATDTYHDLYLYLIGVQHGPNRQNILYRPQSGGALAVGVSF
jgi:hypothetical protein